MAFGAGAIIPSSTVSIHAPTLKFIKINKFRWVVQLEKMEPTKQRFYQRPLGTLDVEKVAPRI